MKLFSENSRRHLNNCTGILPACQGDHPGQATGGGDCQETRQDTGAGADQVVPAERGDHHSQVDQEGQGEGEHGGECDGRSLEKHGSTSEFILHFIKALDAFSLTRADMDELNQLHDGTKASWDPSYIP